MEFFRLAVIPWALMGESAWVEVGWREVTRQQSAAANPEYADFLCDSKLTAGA